MTDNDKVAYIKRVAEQFNALPQEERKKISKYTSQEKVRTLYQLRKNYANILPPIAIRKIKELEDNIMNFHRGEV